MRDAESWVLSYLLNSLWQAPLLLAAGWCAARMVRRLGADAEHRVWLWVLLLQCMLPALSSFSFDWLRGLSVWHATTGTAASSVAIAFGPGQPMGGISAAPILLTFLLWAYLLVTAYFLAQFLWRFLHLRRLNRNGTPLALPGDMLDCWLAAQQRFGIHSPALATSAELQAPVTFGLKRSVVLLPTHMVRTLDSTDLRTILDHECAHIRRRDFAMNIACELVSIPVRFHPAVRVSRERITETREMACDQLAAASAGSLAYGRSLLRIASLLVLGPHAHTPHAIGIFDAQTLERRVMRLKQAPPTAGRWFRNAVIAASVLFITATCVSAVALRTNISAEAAHSADRGVVYIHVAPGQMQGKVVHKVAPQYPPEAKKKRIQGTVVLSAVISKKGDIEKLDVISGPKALRQSALDAVRQWKYEPYLLKGEPVAVKTTINVIYSLAKSFSGKVPPPPPPPPPPTK